MLVPATVWQILNVKRRQPETEVMWICRNFHGKTRKKNKNETQILQIVAFIMQFYTYFNTYNMNWALKNALSLLIWSFI